MISDNAHWETFIQCLIETIWNETESETKTSMLHAQFPQSITKVFGKCSTENVSYKRLSIFISITAA